MANDDIRTQLSERRNSLATAMERMGRSDHLTHLLREVDDALGKLNSGTYGICETCGEAIEGERLAIDPLIRNCLDHLTPMEQRVLEHDLDLAHQVQSALLPKRGARLGPWSVVYHYEAAGPVSGDYLDIVPLQHDPGSFLFLMGDVTGKGVAASILMSQLHAIFRSLSRSMLPLGELLKQANRLFCEGTTSRYFATIVCGKVSPNGDIEVSNAGHPSPALLQSDGVHTIASKSLPFGMFCDGQFATTTIRTSPGDKLVLYTDGLIEARNARDELYGEERLLVFLERASRSSAEEILKNCLDDMRAFRAGSPKLDDTAVMILSRSAS